MSKSKRKVVVTTKKETNKPKATTSKIAANSGSRSSVVHKEELIYGWSHYKIMLIGFGVILLGMFLMMGGNMPSSDVWDEGIIYSFRRTVLAPFVILVGLGIEVYAILKSK